MSFQAITLVIAFAKVLFEWHTFVILMAKVSFKTLKCHFQNRHYYFLRIWHSIHLGNESEEVTLLRSTVRRARKSNRQNYALQKRNDFVPTAPLLLHWDGKMLPGPTRVHTDRENRVAVVVSWKNNEMLLGASLIPSGTGKDHANVCIEL